MANPKVRGNHVSLLSKVGHCFLAIGFPGFVLLASSFAARQCANAQTVLPLTEKNRTLFVTIKLNDKPAVFLLDTGARNSMVTPEALERSPGASPASGAKLSGLGGSNISISEAPVQIEVVPHNVVYLHVGVAKLPDYMKGCDGLLGNDVLSKFSRILIDYKARTLIVWD